MKSFSAQHRTQTLSGYETTGNPVVVRTQKETGLLFKSEMVIATLEDRKTKTRRLRGLEKLNGGYYKDRIAKVECRHGLWCFWDIGDGSSALPVFSTKCPYGGKGDILYCKETACYQLCDGKKEKVLHYRADGYELEDSRVWTPSIFMPRWASRITLEITEVRVERLTEIDPRDCIEEGIDFKKHECGCEVCARSAKLCPATTSSLIMEYSQLWDSINIKTFPWSSNPWLWVIAFKRV